jgi:hypothetical protein
MFIFNFVDIIKIFRHKMYFKCKVQKVAGQSNIYVCDKMVRHAKSTAIVNNLTMIMCLALFQCT